jgi:hypothetical protein
MDRSELTGDSQTVMREAVKKARGGVWVALPGIIQSFDAETMTCTVQPATRARRKDETGDTQDAALPLLVDCPVQFPGGGGCSLTFPVATGDECLIIFSSRSVDAWWQSGEIQNQYGYRTHSLSDGFVLLGFRSLPRVLANVSTSAAQLRSDGGETFVELDPAGHIVTVKAPGGMVIDAPTVTMTGAIAVQNSHGASTACAITGNTAFNGQVSANGKRIDDSHTHGGVQPGSGNSGAPN